MVCLWIDEYKNMIRREPFMLDDLYKIIYMSKSSIRGPSHLLLIHLLLFTINSLNNRLLPPLLRLELHKRRTQEPRIPNKSHLGRLGETQMFPFLKLHLVTMRRINVVTRGSKLRISCLQSLLKNTMHTRQYLHGGLGERQISRLDVIRRDPRRRVTQVSRLRGEDGLTESGNC